MLRLFGLALVVLLLAACSDPATSTQPEAATTAAPTTSSSAPSSSTAGTTTTVLPSTTTTTLPALTGLAWEEVADVDGFVTAIEPVGDEMLVATKDGLIRRFGPDGAPVVFDLSGLVRDRGERGLLDLAVHPDGTRFFVHYTAADGDTVLGEVTLPDGAQPVELYRTGQPASNHNGGSIEFGPDGMLYLALGDGGGANDRYGHGQNLESPLGAIHRFDVSTEGSAVPASGNPFLDGPVPSMWAYGVRNPWRIAFTTVEQPGSGGPSLIVADVGQNAWEEVTVLPASAAGQNLGWPIQEGRHCFSRSPCDDPGIRMAQLEVAHGDGGTCSISGGEVYAGTAIPELRGHYVFTDFCGGYLRSIDVWSGVDEPATAVDWEVDRLSGPALIVAGPDGELLASGQDGRILRLVAVRNR